MKAARRLALIALLGVLVGVGSCSKGPPPPNVVIISVDTLRADHLGYHGYFRPASRSIDHLAQQAVVFEHCYSQSGWTLPSMATVLTGRHPLEHGATDFNRRLDPSLPTLASILRSEGYTNRAFISHVLLTPQFGMDKGFDSFDHSVLDVGDPHLVSTAKMLTDRAVQSLETLEEPFFLWVHYFDPHTKYLSHPDWNFGDGRKDRYDEEIAHTDLHIGRLLEKLREAGLDDRTIIVFVADHGEEFKEHGGLEHQTLYEEIVRVPLLIKAPSLGHRKTNHLAQQIDLLPTILELLGVAPPDGLPGTDLLADEPRQQPIFMERDRPVQFRQRSVIDWPDKLTIIEPVDLSNYPDNIYRDPPAAITHLTPGIFLYDLAADAAESHNLYTKANPTATRLAKLLSAHFAGERISRPQSSTGDGGMDADLEKQLRSLGYIK